MAFDFHADRRIYYQHQILNTEEYVIPFIEEGGVLEPGSRVLEIGCAEGGVLTAFINRGCTGVGVELSELRFEQAHEFMKEFLENGTVELYNKNIYDEGFQEQFKGQFDLIILKDVIEHIHDQPKLMTLLHNYLKPNGKIYFGFPPWQMPFGGHQQICKNKVASLLPYYHLLPLFLYKAMLRMFGESDNIIADLEEIKETGISLERFERIVKETGYTIQVKTLYFINPIYKVKFGLKPRKQLGLIAAIPWLRNFFTTCGYYLITPAK